MFRPSIRMGRPAFGMALIGLEVSGNMRSMVSSVAFGPTEQFRPITSTGHESISRVKASVSAPPGRWPKSSMVTCATTARSSPAASRAALTASRSSSRLPNVSRISRSTPASTSASICSRNAARASAKEVGPSGSMRTPSGPTAPATNAPPCAASRASRTAARLISRNFSAMPNAARRGRLAPKVFVSRISAPAFTYSWWICRTMSGAERLNSSKQRLMNTPREYNIVPMAPSATRTRRESWSRNSCARVPVLVVISGREAAIWLNCNRQGG